jgi:hypothetical protein
MLPSTTKPVILTVDKHIKLDRYYFSRAKRKVSVRHNSVLPLCHKKCQFMRLIASSMSHSTRPSKDHFGTAYRLTILRLKYKQLMLSAGTEDYQH